jgi:tetratricopeptide (TPR) repeat protein
VRAEALNDVGLSELGEGAGAEALLKESLALRRELGDEQNVGDSLNNLGWAALLRGAYPEARRYLEESLDIARRLEDDFHTALARDNLGLVALFEGRYADAVELLTANVRLCADRADRRIGAESLRGLAAAFAGLGEAAAAVQLAATADQLLDSMRIELWPTIEERIAPLLTRAESSLDAASAESLKNHGRALTLTQAADLATDALGTQAPL